MRIDFCIFAVLCLINVGMVSSEVGLAFTKKCEDFVLEPVDNFQILPYVGDWFTYKLYDVPDATGYNCCILFTTPLDNGSFNVTEAFIKPGVLPFRKDGVSTFNSEGKGIISYVSQDFPEYNGDYFVLKTDYVTYTIEVSCKNDVSGTGSFIQLYVMTRTANVLTPSIQAEIVAAITASGLDASALRTLDIQSCPSELTGGGGLLNGLVTFVKNLLKGLLGILG